MSFLETEFIHKLKLQWGIKITVFFIVKSIITYFTEAINDIDNSISDHFEHPHDTHHVFLSSNILNFHQLYSLTVTYSMGAIWAFLLNCTDTI